MDGRQKGVAGNNPFSEARKDEAGQRPVGLGSGRLRSEQKGGGRLRGGEERWVWDSGGDVNASRCDERQSDEETSGAGHR